MKRSIPFIKIKGFEANILFFKLHNITYSRECAQHLYNSVLRKGIFPSMLLCIYLPSCFYTSYLHISVRIWIIWKRWSEDDQVNYLSHRNTLKKKSSFLFSLSIHAAQVISCLASSYNLTFLVRVHSACAHTVKIPVLSLNGLHFHLK